MSTSPAPTGRRRWPVVLATALAVVAVVVLVWLLVVRALLGDDAGANDPPTSAAPTSSAVASPTSEAPSPTPSAEPSATATSPEPTATTAAGTTEQVTLWFAGEHEDTVQNPALYPEPTDVDVVAGGSAAQAAVTALLSTLPADPDYGNAFWDAASEDSGRTPATAVVTVGGAGTTVDLTADAFDVGVGSAYAELGVRALVDTVLSNGGSAPVTVTVDGAPNAEVWGVLALEDSYAADEQAWTSASVTSVRDGATVSSPVTLSGVGFGFEGELDVLVLDEATGDVVEQTFVAVSGGAELTPDGEPVRSAYEIDVDLDPGTYRLVVADANESDEGPRWVSYDDKVVTVG